MRISPFTGDTLEGESGFEPSVVADTDSLYYQELARLAQEMNPDGLVSPYLILGSTDARHYGKLTPNCFRFAPMRIDEGELNRMHGVDERLSFENCARMVQFYIAFLQAFASDEYDMPLPTDFEDEF